MSQPNRRKLRFRTLDDLVRDIEQFRGTEPDSSGKWSAAQNIDHVAALIDASVDGFDFKVPAVIRLMVRLMRNRFLTKGLNPGIKMPDSAPDAFKPSPDTRFADAVDHLQRAVERAKQQGMTAVSPVFGKLTHDQWEQLHCRHAELHFSFIQPDGKARPHVQAGNGQHAAATA
ncbi:MAG: hypothetical protein Kow00105_04460 [Phycisphaeraceae bacterium]